MGRRAGVSSDETRQQLLAAAMRVVAERGYDGTRVAEIARVAGVTTGAIYNHFDSKADLLTAAIAEQGPDAFTNLIDVEPTLSAHEVFRRLGVALPGRSHRLSGPIMEVIVAARRDEDVAKALTVSVSDREGQRRALIERAQADGEMDAQVDAAALPRFTTIVGFGAMVADALGLDPVGDDDWSVVIDRLLSAVRTDQPEPMSQPDDTEQPDRSNRTAPPQGEPT